MQHSELILGPRVKACRVFHDLAVQRGWRSLTGFPSYDKVCKLLDSFAKFS
jgi:hypothetical protein